MNLPLLIEFIHFVYSTSNVVGLLHFPYSDFAPYFSAAVKGEIVELGCDTACGISRCYSRRFCSVGGQRFDCDRIVLAKNIVEVIAGIEIIFS